MSRRRALLAASQTGGGSILDTWLQFPLYFDFDYCENNFFSVYCARNADDTSIELRNLIQKLFISHGIYKDNAYILEEDVLETLEINIYFKNIRVKRISLHDHDNQTIQLLLDGEYEIEDSFGEMWVYSFVLFRGNGEIFIEL